MGVVTASNSALVPPSDEQLIACFRRGNHSALDVLFQRYRAVAYRVAYRLLGNEADALDAVQDGFIKALSNLKGFEGRSTFKTWLLRIISNASLDLGRQRGRRENVFRSDSPKGTEFEPLAAPENPASELERADLRHLLQEALAQLPVAQRQTFILHVDGELSYREVADVLGISIGTVMSRLFYARQKLRTLLAGKLPP
jgi:RNA polymerase sigma-70 factor (ECF subfamily)